MRNRNQVIECSIVFRGLESFFRIPCVFVLFPYLFVLCVCVDNSF